MNSIYLSEMKTDRLPYVYHVHKTTSGKIGIVPNMRKYIKSDALNGSLFGNRRSKIAKKSVII